eukprot:NODE_148_length_15570_cov_0.950100.p2 type:complete len:687 gc:universal NODE_148_length_15570_cov_0.950100:14922-12862(-)
MQTWKLIAWIFLWYMCTSLSNIQLKLFLKENNIFLACFGSLAVSMILFPFYLPKYDLIDEKLHTSNSKMSFLRPFYNLSIFHLCNALFTLYAFKYSSIQFNYTIKAFEPFVSGFLSIIILNQRLATKQWLTLIPIPIGVALATITDTSFNFDALIISLSSVFVTCCRSVVFKKMKMDPMQSFVLSSGLSGFFSIILYILYSLIYQFNVPNWSNISYLCYGSIFYFLYNLSSFMILNELHPVSHAIANVFKRIVSIVYAWIYFHASVNFYNILGITIAYLGVMGYGATKNKRKNTFGGDTRNAQKILRNISLSLLLFVFVLQGSQDEYRTSITIPLESDELKPLMIDAPRILRRFQCLNKIQEAYLDTFKKVLPKHTSAFLMDAPDHENLGDSFIWLGEEIAMAKLGINLKSCTTSKCRKVLKNKEINNEVILMHGGGNWGDLYRWSPELRNSVVKKYPDNKIVFMPQSVFYANDTFIENDQHIYAAHNDLHLMVRSTRSKDILDDVFSDNEFRYLVPDSAFMIGHQEPLCKPTKDVLFLKRTDPESILGDEYMKLFKTLFKDVSYDIIDWEQYPELEQVNNPFYNGLPENEARLPLFRLQIANRLFCGYKVVLTDRLHASVMAMLMDKPVVCLENNYGKIFGVTNLLSYFGGPDCNPDIVRRYYAPQHDLTLAYRQVKDYLAVLKQ